MDFWWNSDEAKRKIHWIKWESLSLPKNLGGLGFRDLSVFNQAMLAKQSWRLLTEPSSLFAQVFKSRYYPLGNILNAATDKRPSYIWRSVLFGRELLFQGIGKLIGNGRDTNLWLDNWICDVKPRRPFPSIQPRNLHETVHCLIDESNSVWNLTKLRLMFNAQDVFLICQRKPMSNRQDRYYWYYCKDGKFSVKSAYKLGSRVKHKEIYDEAESKPSLLPLYDECWLWKGPSKINHFLWRILRGSLAVTQRIKARGMKVYDGCLYRGEEETVNHLLFSCSFARQVWALSCIPHDSNGFSSSIFENTYYLFTLNRNLCIPEELREFSPWILWQLWKNRNKLIFEGVKNSTQEVLELARKGRDQWRAAQNQEFIVCQNVELGTVDSVWRAPPQGELKCNLSFSWSNNRHISGASWVLRNHNGQVLTHSRRSYSNVFSLIEAKFKCWESAIRCMDDLHHDKVVFACSSMDTVTALYKPNDHPAWLGFIEPILVYTGSKPNWCLQFEAKCCNVGALRIAQSVTQEGRFTSYVAAGLPTWLRGYFEEEQRQSMISR